MIKPDKPLPYGARVRSNLTLGDLSTFYVPLAFNSENLDARRVNSEGHVLSVVSNMQDFYYVMHDEATPAAYHYSEFELLELQEPVTDLRANVRAFHAEVIEGELPEGPCVPPEVNARRRLRLLKEEFFEVLRSALSDDSARGDLRADLRRAESLIGDYIASATLSVNLPAFARELADLAYVTEGCFVGFGIDSRPVHAEVHRTNMAKKGGPMREDGKRLKPPGWEPPNITPIIEAQKTAGAAQPLTIEKIPPNFRPGR